MTALHIGLATADITPPIGATMVGYNPRESTSVGHPLRAEALACREGADGPGWLLLAGDTIGYRRAMADAIRAAVAADLGLPVEAVMLSATHTHSGPATIRFGHPELSPVDRAALEKVSAGMCACARAWNDVAPGTFEVTRVDVRELVSNRRVQQADGSWGNEWEDAEGRHPGTVDPEAVVVGIRRGDTLAGLLVNMPCHPVTLGPQSLALSPDYVGYLKDRVEEEIDGPVLLLLSGAGNINPRVCIHEGAEFPRAMGEDLADRVLGGLVALKPVPAGSPRWHEEPWAFERTRMNPKRSFPAERDVRTSLQAVRAGGFGVASIPGELFCEFNEPLRAVSPCDAALVATVANDYIGYLPTDEAQRQGAYETNMAPCEDLEQDLLDHARRAWDAIA